MGLSLSQNFSSFYEEWPLSNKKGKRPANEKHGNESETEEAPAISSHSIKL